MTAKVFYEVRARHHGTLTVTVRHESLETAQTGYAEVDADPTCDRCELVVVIESLVVARGDDPPIDSWTCIQIPRIVRTVEPE